MAQLLVSVIIPTYSRATYITRAIDSVLNQTYKNIELIIVDDNGQGTPSQIATSKTIERYNNTNIHYIIHEKNRNGSAARNTGIRNSRGAFVAFLDDDDEFVPEKIEKQVETLVSKPNEYGAIYSGYRFFDNKRVKAEKKAYLEGNLQLELLKMKFHVGSGSNVLFEREVFDNIGLYDESFIRHQDWEFLVRFFRKYKIAAIPDILLNIYMDSRINNPHGAKYLAIKEKFLSTFEEDINNYNKNDRNEIYRNHWEQFALDCLKIKDIKNAVFYYRKAISYKCLSLKMICKIAYFTFFSRNY